MRQENFYDDHTYRDLIARLARLTPDAVAVWGTMSAAQTCAHCAEVAEVANGKALVGTPWYIRLIGGWIKKEVLSDKPYPRGSKTHPQYVIERDLEFEEQRTRLLAVLQATHAAGRAHAADIKHPLFGAMTADERGWATYKHLDHHLRQFGL